MGISFKLVQSGLNAGNKPVGQAPGAVQMGRGCRKFCCVRACV